MMKTLTTIQQNFENESDKDDALYTSLIKRRRIRIRFGQFSHFLLTLM